MVSILYCVDNIASINLFNELKINKLFLDLINLKKINVVEFSKSVLYPPKIDDDLLIILSTHKSKSNDKTLTIHTPGNYFNADFGGKEKTLSVCDGDFMYLFLLNLKKNYELEKIKNLNSKDYNISYEVDHHGPSFDVPICFVEIGSTIDEWNDPFAIKIISNSLINCLIQYFNINNLNLPKRALCVGGGHYAPYFTKKALENKVIPYHIIPKYQLENLSEEVFIQAIKKNTKKIDFVLIDWKGCGKYKEKIICFCKKHKIEFKKNNNL